MPNPSEHPATVALIVSATVLGVALILVLVFFVVFTIQDRRVTRVLGTVEGNDDLRFILMRGRHGRLLLEMEHQDKPGRWRPIHFPFLVETDGADVDAAIERTRRSLLAYHVQRQQEQRFLDLQTEIIEESHSRRIAGIERYWRSLGNTDSTHDTKGRGRR